MEENLGSGTFSIYVFIFSPKLTVNVKNTYFHAQRHIKANNQPTSATMSSCWLYIPCYMKQMYTFLLPAK